MKTETAAGCPFLAQLPRQTFVQMGRIVAWVSADSGNIKKGNDILPRKTLVAVHIMIYHIHVMSLKNGEYVISTVYLINEDPYLFLSKILHPLGSPYNPYILEKIR